jgi:D-alanine-D-alanine ligase
VSTSCDNGQADSGQSMLVAYLDHRWADEDEDELDGYAQYRENVDLVAAALQRCGHPAVPFDVGRTPRLLADALDPSITVFNFVERVNSGSGTRPWYVPDIVKAAGACYIGPSARTLARVTDKSQTKAACACVLRTPPSVAVDSLSVDLWRRIEELALPAIVKPNCEAGSRGISDAAVVDSRAELRRAIGHQLGRYPSGVLVEEFIDGDDVTVAFLEVDGDYRCLPPVLYRAQRLRPSRRRMYDYAAKNAIDHREAQLAGSHAECPAPVDPRVATELVSATTAAAAVLGVRGFGRADFRVSRAGEAHFLEMNALPDIDPTAGFAIASNAVGMSLDVVVQAVINSYRAREEPVGRGPVD